MISYFFKFLTDFFDSLRQRSLQNRTCSQVFSHFFRQAKGREHWQHIFVDKFDFLCVIKDKDSTVVGRDKELLYFSKEAILNWQSAVGFRRQVGLYINNALGWESGETCLGE